jgi:hypothetical protein
MSELLDEHFLFIAEVQTETLPIPRGILGSSTTWRKDMSDPTDRS